MVKMGKISPVSAKYIVHSFINIEGVVDRPDIIGAVFGQTEGLLGNELELRELQRSGRIGRIEVNIETKAGKTSGSIIIPSSLDKAETAIVGASLETIQRIGPCNAKVRVQRIEDIRISKRSYVLERAKELLRTLTDSVLPDSQEMTDEVAQSVRMMEIKEYTKDRHDKLKEMLENLIGTRGAYILDQSDKILGKVPTSELATTVGGLKSEVHTLVFDGSIDRELVGVAERAGVKYLVGMNSNVKPSEARLDII